MNSKQDDAIFLVLLAVGFGAAWLYGLIGVGLLLGVVVGRMTMITGRTVYTAIIYYLVAALALAFGAIIWTARSLSINIMSVITSNLETLFVGAIFVIITYIAAGELNLKKAAPAVAV